MMCGDNRRRFMELFTHKIESVYENVHTITGLPIKAYLSAITVTGIFRSFTYKMAPKTGWHRYGTKLRHCHPVYISARSGYCTELCSALQHHLSGTLSLSPFRTVTRLHYLNLHLKHICSPPSMLLNCPVRQRL